ncbi:MAG: hypothetical protein ACRD1O_05170, partial [Terriglobia bacterium]
VWNRANGHCDWYDTVANEVGGSDISGVQHTVGFYGFPTPLSMTAPSVGGSGGSFTTGAAYCFDETIVTRTEVKPGNFGEETTPGSTQCTAALTAGEEITLSRPPRGSDSISQDYVYIDSGAGGVPNGWNVYGCQEVAVGTPCAPNAIQNTSNEISWASGNTTLVSFASGGAAPPATNVAGYMIHQGRIAPAGNFVYFTGGGGDELGGAANTVFAWILNTETGWAANTAYVAGNVIKDSNGHLETAQDAFTSGSSAPAWSATTGGTTIDNGGTWMMSQGATNAVNLSYLGGHTVPAGGFVIFNNGGSTDPGGWNTDFEQIPLLGATVPAPHGGNYAGSRPVPGFSAAGDLHPSIGTDYGGADKVPFCASSDARGSTSIAMGGGTFPAPNGTTIRWPNSGFNPDWGVGAPGFGEIMCFAMDGSGKEWRFGHTRSSFAGDNKSSPAAGNWFASYVLGDVSRDGNLMIFTSSWAWDLGTANYWSWAPNISYTSGTVINDSNGNLETAGSNFTSGAVEPNWSKSVGGTTPDNGGTWTMKFGCPTVAACRWDVFVMELK